MRSRLLHESTIVIVITLQVVVAKNTIKKIRGLIGAQEAYPLLLNTRFGIHTFGLRFPIDVIVLDNNQKVVQTKIHLAQNRLFFWNPRYSTVIELPHGSIKKYAIKIGTILAFNPRG